MTEVDYKKLQQRYGGLFIARRDEDVVVSATTYDELADGLERMRTRVDDLVIEYVEPIGMISVY